MPRRFANTGRLALILTFLTLSVFSQTVDSIPAKRELITQPVNNGKRVTLVGNTRREVGTAVDRGRVADSLALDHMLLQLQRPAELEQALDQFLKDLQNPASANYHHWVTAADFGTRFGLAQSDIDAVTNWLVAQGFTVNQVYPNKLTIDFSGSAGQVRQAFGTEIHNLETAGDMHIANMNDPQVPAALAPAMAGIVALNDFRPHPLKKARPNYAIGSTQAVVPGDLATIYNLNPLFAKGISGQGQTIVVIEDTNVYSTNDWTTFRSKFGLSSYTSGSFTQTHPGNCSNPGVVAGDDGEAILDAEWASAAAPSAAIQLASCSDTATTFGGLIALQNLINAGGTPPALVSISYGECEVLNGASANASYAATYQQAVAEGVSVFVASGDEGADSCDAGANSATHGIGVSAFASTPYNVAVGGTDFGDTYAGTNSTYWNSTNTSTYSSAKSYVPEVPWDDSCANNLLAGYEGYSQTWGANGFCNSGTGKANFLNITAGSGGPSGCATGSPSTNGVVSGSCRGYAKPSWQSGAFGNPNDGVRDIPDVSLFASNGLWGHYYVYCWSDTANGGASCGSSPSNWSGAGGTSFSAPIFAGIQALVNQNSGSSWGNPNPYYYALAASEYGSGGNSSCLSSNSPASSCTFNDVTLGNMDVVCSGNINCYGSSGTLYGALSTSSSVFGPAYASNAGWDFATGLGSVNAYNLVTNWNGGNSGWGTTQPTSSATYSGLDSSTQGTWTGVYGGDGYLIANDSSNVPAYARLGVTGAATYTWASPTSDVRALQTSSGSSTRIASTYYAGSSFSFDVNLTDGNTHRVALYLLDWDSNSRSETISVLDAGTNSVLSTQSFSGFNGGQYAVWNISGHVLIQVKVTGGVNAVVSGLLFGPAGTVSSPLASATYTGTDTSTQGTWTGTYGGDGYQIANNTTALPSYAAVSSTGASYTWSASTSDVRALQTSSGSSSRIASTYFGGSFTFDVNLTDGNTHRISLYLLDWDNNSRSESISIVDAGTNTVLSTQSFSSFQNGAYAIWNVKGHVLIQVTLSGGPNAVVSGLFFGPAGASAPSASASYAGADTATQGTWTGKYGSNGELIANDLNNTPSFAAVSMTGASAYTWSSPTSDARALQIASGSGSRIASTYFASGSFSFDVNLTDGNTHKVSLYLLDWDSTSRAETISILDASSNTVLSTQSFSSFQNGEYAVWNIKGHVRIQVTLTGGANAVVSGLFFD